MNLTYSEVVEILSEDGMRVGRAVRKVPLELLAAVEPGDRVLLCDGVAISRVDENAAMRKNHVPRDSR